MKFGNVLITTIARCLFQLCEACLILKQAGSYETRTTWWRNLGIMECSRKHWKKTQYPFLTLPRSQRWWDSLTWATCSGSLFHRHHASWCDTECILLGLGSCKRVYSHRSTSLSRFTFPQKRILQRKLWDDSAAKVIMAVRDDDQSSVPRPHLWEESDDSHDISWSPWASMLSSERTHAPSPAHDMIIK